MVRQFAQTPLEHRDVDVFCGMLWELSTQKPELADELLDEAVENESLARYFPALQASVKIDSRGMARASRSAELAKAPIRAFAELRLGRAIEVVRGVDIAHFITNIAKQPQGESVAIHFLNAQFFGDRQDKRLYSLELVAAGRELLRNMEFDGKNRREDYDLGGVVEVCMAGDDDYDLTKALCERLRRSGGNRKTYGHDGHDHDQLVNSLLKVQPRAVLNGFFTGDENLIRFGKSVIEEAGQIRSNPMDVVSEATLLEWCGEDPSVRFPIAASVVSAFVAATDSLLQPGLQCHRCFGR